MFRLYFFVLCFDLAWTALGVPELVRRPEPTLVRPQSKAARGRSAARRLPRALLERIQDAAQRALVDPLLVEAMVWTESGGKELATSSKGAMGLMQVIPSTADACGIHNAYHAVDNLMGACQCLRTLINRYRGNLRLALAAYNAGPKHVDRLRDVPNFPETKDYVKKVLERYRALQKTS